MANARTESVSLPWPGRDVDAGDRVELRHTARPEWTMSALVVLALPGRYVEILPDEEINSPANWRIVEL